MEGLRDTQAHILICPGYSELRENKDLATDKDLVGYFRLVIQKRLQTDVQLLCSNFNPYQGTAGRDRGTLIIIIIIYSGDLENVTGLNKL